MDWLQQAQNMFQTWTEAQQKMWRTLTESATTMTSSAGAWTKTVQTWSNSVKNLIETQALWARTWARDAVTNSDVPHAEDVINSFESMTQMWVETQQQLWANWFEMIKRLDPGQLTPELRDQFTKAMGMMQDNMKTIMETQQQWAKQLSEMIPGRTDEK